MNLVWSSRDQEALLPAGHPDVRVTHPWQVCSRKTWGILGMVVGDDPVLPDFWKEQQWMPHSWGQLHQGAGRLDVLRMSAPKKKKNVCAMLKGSLLEQDSYLCFMNSRLHQAWNGSSLSFFFFFPIQTENLGKSPKALETTGISSAVPVTWKDLTLNKRDL